MSAETVAASGVGDSWPVLDLHERRILGVLVEKAKTTPDAYPMSINALVTGSNQKSNRDPILELDDADVEDALNRCKGRGVVTKVVGGRVDRWRHLLYETWHVDKIELAILAELLLRGPQTEGELRTRANRMETIDDLDTLRNRLRPLVDRKLVVYLTPEDRRGAVLTHGFHDANELERLRRHHTSATASVAPPTSPSVALSAPLPAPRPDERVTELQAALEQVREEMATLRQQMSDARQQIVQMRSRLDTTEKELASLRQALGG